MSTLSRAKQIIEARKTDFASAADAGVAAALCIARGSPCLVIERRTWSVGQPVTHVRFAYKAESHVVVARFTPSQG